MKYLLNLLSEMSAEQKEPIVKILGLKNNSDEKIIEKLSKVLLPVAGFWQTPLTYNQFVEKIAEENNEKVDWSLGTSNAEKKLYLDLFQQEFEKLTEAEKQNIYKEWEKAGLNKNQLIFLSGISAIGAAQLSGFGIYLLASSTVGAITSVLGITLPFAFYTGMSSIISFVIGPVGFLVMGVMIYRRFRHIKSWDEALDLLKNSWDEFKKLALGDIARGTLAFKYFAATRIILTENFKSEMQNNGREITNKKNDINLIRTKVKETQKESNIVREQTKEKENYAAAIKVEISKKEADLAVLKNDILGLEQKIKSYELSNNSNLSEISQIEKKISILETNSNLLSLKIKKLLT